MIEREGEGVLLYLAQEGRGIGLLNKLRAYRLQEDGLDTVEANERLGLPADLRDYGIGAQILVDLGLSSIRILTNNPKKIRGLEGYGLSVTAQIPIEHAPNPHNEAYLRTKAERMGHTLHHQGLDLDAEMLHSEREHDRDGAEDRAERERTARRVSERFAIAVGRFYEELAERLEAGARERVREARAMTPSRCSTCPARSSCRWRRSTPRAAARFAGVACLGAVIRGETDHYDYRLRRGRARDPGGGSCAPACRAPSACSPRHDGAGARARRRRQARPGPPRRRGRAGDGRTTERAGQRLDWARAMAKVCHSCGKGPAFGNSRSHSMVATKRRFDPNLQKVRILVGKAPRRVYVCTRCLKAGKVTKAALSASAPGAGTPAGRADIMGAP